MLSEKTKKNVDFYLFFFLNRFQRKQKRLDIEQAKVQERMEMYERQDQQRAERKSSISKRI